MNPPRPSPDERHVRGSGSDRLWTRRRFLLRSGQGLGAVAFAPLLRRAGDELPLSHVAPRAQRVIFLFMSGGTSQLDLFDPKPTLVARTGQPMPDSVTQGQRVAQLRGRELIIVGSRFAFRRHGESGAEISELLPYTARIADRIAIIRSMHTESINHDPGVTMMQTGFEQPGRPSIGAWVSYALGGANPSLPPFIVLVSGAASGAQPLFSRLWSAGFLPGHHQGVRMHGGADPVLFLADPAGVDRTVRRRMLDDLRALNQLELEASGDLEVATRTAAYEMALRMQESVPELMDLSREPASVLEMYGVEPGKPSFAANCLLARRMAERGVRFVQLYHRGWDHHDDLPEKLSVKCHETDRASAALVADLAQRGLLDDTIVIWGSEFGRSPMNQGNMADGNYGRDHHGKAFALWMAGGGIKPGITYGRTDELGYGIEADPVHVNDFHATLLYCLGIQHKKLTFRHEGRDFRLTDVAGNVVEKLLA